MLAAVCAAAAEELSTEQLTRRLAEMIHVSERQLQSGRADGALETLQQARLLAAASGRAEVSLIEARIERTREALAAVAVVPAAEPIGAQEPGEPGAAGPGDEKVGGEAEPPKGILLLLNECIEISIQNNLALKISRLNDRASDLGLRTAWAKYLPSFSLEASHGGAEAKGSHSNSTAFTGRINQSLPTGGSVSVFGKETEAHPLSSVSRSASFGTSLSQPLWKGAGFDVGLHDIRAAKLNKLMARGNLELDLQALIFDVRRAYANCIRQLQALEVNAKAVASARTFLRLTTARAKAGQVTQLEVFNAEVQVSDRELSLTANQRALESAFDTLKQIMDVDLEELVRVEEQPVDFGEKPTAAAEEQARKIIETDEKAGTVLLATYEVKKVKVRREEKVFEGGQEKVVTREETRSELGGRVGEPRVMFKATRYQDAEILQEALQNRIQLLNKRRTLALQKLDTLLAKDGLGQQVDLTASYNRSGSGQKWPDALDHENNDYSVGLRYSVPWGKISDRAAFDKALLELQKSEIELKRTRTQIHLEVRDILRTLRETEKSILIQGKKVEQAKRSVEAAQISFERGLKDSFDVIKAEDNLLQAKTDFINRRLDYVVRVAELETVVGKTTGRVDLDARQPGGLIEGGLPANLKERGLPRPAPNADSRPEDDPFEYLKKK